MFGTSLKKLSKLLRYCLTACSACKFEFISIITGARQIELSTSLYFLTETNGCWIEIEIIERCRECHKNSKMSYHEKQVGFTSGYFFLPF